MGCALSYREGCAVEVVRICLFGRPESVLPLASAPVIPPISEYSDWHINNNNNNNNNNPLVLALKKKGIIRRKELIRVAKFSK